MPTRISFEKKTLSEKRKAFSLILFFFALILSVVAAKPVYASTCEPRSDALKGKAESQNLLGLAYIDGKKGCDQNIEKGIRWLKKAAANGSENAIDNLCWAYGGGNMPNKSGKMIANPLLPIQKEQEAYWCGQADDAL